MKKTLLTLSLFLAVAPLSNSQNWTKVSGILDMSQIKGVGQTSDGILIAGQNWASSSVTDYAFSIDGNTWTSVPTYSFAGYLPNSLPINNSILCSNGFTATKKLTGSTWSDFGFGANNFAEFGNGEIIGSIGSYPDSVYHFSSSGVKGTVTGDYKFKLGSKFCSASNNRLFLWAYGVGIGYLDYTDLSTIHVPATLDGIAMDATQWDMRFITDIKMASNGDLFAAGAGLFKSIDNGENWITILNTSGDFVKSIALNSLDEIYIVAPGILYIEIFKSSDNGSTFTNISGNLTSINGLKSHVFTNAANELFITINNNGSAEPANSGIFKLDGLNSIDEMTAAKSFSIFPNPSSGEFTFQSLVGTEATISIVNLIGSEVLKLEANATQTLINISNQPAGVYFVRATINGETQTQKITIQ